MASKHFRAGVVIVVLHPDRHLILAFERADTPGSWQLPQGGLRTGEQPVDGARRELHEETGLDDSSVVLRSEFPEWLAYEWPAEVQAEQGGSHARIGQVQKWFFFEALSPDVQPVPDGREFTAWKWVEPQWLIQHVSAWRRPPYERALSILSR